MTVKQRLQVEQSELRQSVNASLERAELDDAQRAELATKTARLQALEVELRAAIVAEASAPEPVERNGGEGAEIRRLAGRVEVRHYLTEAATGRDADGVAHELRAAVLGENARAGLLPWQALLPCDAIEQRADAATSAPSEVARTQASVLGRVFAQSAASYLGVSMPSVGLGERSYPVMTGGVTPAQKAAGAGQDAQAGAFSTTELAPVRLTANYLLRVEDLRRMVGFEATLRADLRAALGDAMDSQIISGSGTSPNVAGFLGGGLTAPSDPGSTNVGFSDFVSTVAGGIDGKFAAGLDQVRSLFGVATAAKAETAFVTNSDVSASAYLRQHAGGVRASANVPAAASNIQGGLLAKAGAPGNAVAPIWEALELVRDPYTSAKSGEVRLTAVALWNFKILRSDAYKRLKFKLA